MKLKPEEKAALVTELTTNCDAWQHEGSEAVLNALPDDQLVTLAMNHDQHSDLSAIVGSIQQEFGLPGDMLINEVGPTLKQIVVNAASGVAFDGRNPSGQEDEGEEEQDDDREGSDEGEESDFEAETDPHGGREGEYVGDSGTDGVGHQGQTNNRKHPKAGTSTNNQQRSKPMTMQEWLKTVPPEFRPIVANSLRHDAEVKQQLIETITANANNPFSEDQLNRMNTDQLAPLAQLSRPLKPVVRNARREVTDFFTEPAADYRGASAATRNGHVTENAAHEEDGEERGPYAAPTINWKENAQMIREGKL